MDHRKVTEEWTATCGRRISELMPNLSAASAIHRAQQMFHDACDFPPRQAAEVYAQEWAPDGRPYVPDARGDWSLVFVLEGAREEDVARAVSSAQAVFRMCCVPVRDAARTMRQIDQQREFGGHPSERRAEQEVHLRVWLRAERAANDAIDAPCPRGEGRGRLGAERPSVAHFHAAYRRWARSHDGDSPLRAAAPSPAKSAWLDRFATHLGTLQTDVTPALAWQQAEVAFARVSSVRPEQAAELLARRGHWPH